VYATLRKIWGTWDRADPSHVEEALRAATRDTHLSAPARAYAGTLSALGRARRGDLKAARDSIRALGYVDQWQVVGPFDNEGKAGLDTPSGPEPELLQAIVPGKAYTGKERPVRYRPVPAVFPYGYLDAGSLVRPESKVCVFATSFVSASPKFAGAEDDAFDAPPAAGGAMGVMADEAMEPIGSATGYFPRSRDF